MSSIPPDVEEWIEGKRHIAFIATTVEDSPHVAPVWYIYEEGRFHITTSGAKKIANVRRNPRVAVSIQHDVDGIPEWMVLCWGTATADDDVERIKEVSRTVYTKYMGEPVKDWPEFYRTQLTDPHPDRAILDVDVQDVFSREY